MDAAPIDQPPSRIGSGVALLLSPHLDDVAFSCGGTAALMARLGWRVVVATAFTRSVAEPSGFALACQLDKGLTAEVDYMALRRAEDQAFGKVIGAAENLWLDHAEAPHRGYGSACQLFDEPRLDDDAWQGLASDLAALRDRLEPEIAFAPTGLGRHVDHIQLVRAVGSVPDLARLVVRYRDTPYAMRSGGRLDPSDRPEGTHRVVDIASTLATKIRGAACYATQLGFQFGGVTPTELALERFARAEARCVGRFGHAELFSGSHQHGTPRNPA